MGSDLARRYVGAPLDGAAPSVARWHHNLETVDLEALEALYALLERQAAIARGERPDPILLELRDDAWHRGIDAALATVYRQLLERAGRAVFAGDLALVDVADLNTAARRCESPICHLAHDVDGRHRKVAHL